MRSVKERGREGGGRGWDARERLPGCRPGNGSNDGVCAERERETAREFIRNSSWNDTPERWGTGRTEIFLCFGCIDARTERKECLGAGEGVREGVLDRQVVCLTHPRVVVVEGLSTSTKHEEQERGGERGGDYQRQAMNFENERGCE